MARARQPAALIEAKGKTHYSKAELEARKNSEIQVDFIDVRAPDYLSDEQHEYFYELAHKLIALNIFTELDEGTLARYIIAEDVYMYHTKELTAAMQSNSLELIDFHSRLQDRAFKQCRMSASDLGLTISSRCKLVIPQVEAPKENKFLSKFGGACGER